MHFFCDDSNSMYFTVFFLILLALVGADDEFVDKSQPDTETSLTVEDFEHAKLIQQNESEVFNSSEMYHQDLFEGDIVDDDISPSSGRKRRSIMKNAIRHLSLRWPNGRVPYTISQQYNEQGRAVLAAAIEEYAKLTCIRIVPKTSADNDYVHIAPIRGCSSNIGRIGGMQRMSLVSGCLHKGIIVHEFMHALGFFHEQARADRDNYVTVYYENIQPGMESQFHSRPLSEIDHMGTQYDYQSVMHYDTTAFSKNGRPTILPKQQGVTIGQRRGLSPTDIYKINTMYGCSAASTARPQPPVTTVVTPANCEDKSDRCATISSSGLCDSPSLSEFVRKNCARTCNKCCADKYSWCPRAASLQLCGNRPELMHQYCSKSCGRC